MYRLIIISLLILLFSCDSSEEINDNQTQTNNTSTGDYWTENHCMRSKPIPTIDSTMVENYNFVLEKDKAVEEVKFSNGNKLRIDNEGCEVFWLSYTFFINNYDQNKPNIDLVIYAFDEVKKIDIAPIDFEKASDILYNLKVKGEKLKLGNEYFLKLDDVSEMFEVDEIDLKKDYATIEFSFAIGKL